MNLVALAVSLDGNGIKFGLGDNGNVSVEVDAERMLVNDSCGDINVDTNKYFDLLSGHNNFWGLNTDLGHFYFLEFRILS